MKITKFMIHLNPLKKKTGPEYIELAYITDRKPVGWPTNEDIDNKDPKIFSRLKTYYGNERCDQCDLSYDLGRCWVTIPEAHRFGKVEIPSSILGYKIEKESESKHIVFKGLQRFTDSQFWEYFNVKNAGINSALLFIHGYNTTFEEAAKRTAQIVFDLKFNGIGMFYSWPSHGTISAYTVDTSEIEWTASHLEHFLTIFKFYDSIENLYIIARSMGTRLIGNALQARKDFYPDSDQIVKELILAAPDIDEGVFKKDIAPFLPNLATRTTIYRSGDDRALWASREFNGFSRLGDTRNGITTYHKIDTVDATGFKTDFLGHGGFSSAPELLNDINLTLKGEPIAKRQRLQEVIQDPFSYWRMRQ